MSLNAKLSEIWNLRLSAAFPALLLFICERKFYAPKHVKITDTENQL